MTKVFENSYYSVRLVDPGDIRSRRLGAKYVKISPKVVRHQGISTEYSVLFSPIAKVQVGENFVSGKIVRGLTVTDETVVFEFTDDFILNCKVDAERFGISAYTGISLINIGRPGDRRKLFYELTLDVIHSYPPCKLVYRSRGIMESTRIKLDPSLSYAMSMVPIDVISPQYSFGKVAEFVKPWTMYFKLTKGKADISVSIYSTVSWKNRKVESQLRVRDVHIYCHKHSRPLKFRFGIAPGYDNVCKLLPKIHEEILSPSKSTSLPTLSPLPKEVPSPEEEIPVTLLVVLGTMGVVGLALLLWELVKE
jgi:hypothetical protein